MELLNQQSIAVLTNVANRMRNKIAVTTEYSYASMAEIMAVLILKVIRYTKDDQIKANNDCIVLNKGHAAPVLFWALVEAGLLSSTDLPNFKSHQIKGLPFVDIATGSLGQGLSCAAGMAYTGKFIEQGPYRVYCVLEGRDIEEILVKDALSFSRNNNLDNLVAIFETQSDHVLKQCKKKLKESGWNIIVVDGQNVFSLLVAFNEAGKTSNKSTAILAMTAIATPEQRNETAGVDNGTNEENLHGTGNGVLIPRVPQNILSPFIPTAIKFRENPNYNIKQRVATREAYGTALVKLGDASQRVIALDANTKYSTCSSKFQEKYPNRFIECYEHHQNMIGVAIGCGTGSRTFPFVNTFAAFLTRGFDSIQMGALSQTDCNFAGSHFGVSFHSKENGPSQMELKDLATFLSIPGSTVFYPTDAVSMEKAVELAANTKGICYIRTCRPKTAVIYENNVDFEIGKAKIVFESNTDDVTVVSAGVELHQVLKAANILKQKNSSERVNIRVVDLFTVQPIDWDTLKKCATETGGRLLTVEDHSSEGGLGDAVVSAKNSYFPWAEVKKLGVNETRHSDFFESPFAIGAKRISQTVTDWIRVFEGFPRRPNSIGETTWAELEEPLYCSLFRALGANLQITRIAKFDYPHNSQ